MRAQRFSSPAPQAASSSLSSGLPPDKKKKKRQRNPHLFFLPRGVWDLTSSVCFVPTGNGMTALQHQLLAFADLLGLYCYLDALFFLWLRVSLYQHAEL